jgi:hypothetical protein
MGSGGPEGLAPFDLFSSGDLDLPVEIRPCRHCDAWYVEVRPEPHRGLLVREWHAAGCAHYQALIEEHGLARAMLDDAIRGHCVTGKPEGLES